MLSYTADDSIGLIDIVVDGAITREDYEKLVPMLDAQIARHGKLRVVETVRRIGPIDWSLWWLDLKWVSDNRNKLARCAVVTDHGWIGPITRAASALFSGEMRVFKESEVAEARAWVREE
jgi:hypothetical protein